MFFCCTICVLFTLSCFLCFSENLRPSSPHKCTNTSLTFTCFDDTNPNASQTIQFMANEDVVPEDALQRGDTTVNFTIPSISPNDHNLNMLCGYNLDLKDNLFSAEGKLRLRRAFAGHQGRVLLNDEDQPVGQGQPGGNDDDDDDDDNNEDQAGQGHPGGDLAEDVHEEQADDGNQGEQDDHHEDQVQDEEHEQVQQVQAGAEQSIADRVMERRRAVANV